MKRLYISLLLCLMLPLWAEAQSYEQLWKEVERYQQKDLPRSAIQQISRIYEKARKEKNISQLLKAFMSRAAEQVKLSPDSTENEIKRLEHWAEKESDQVTSAILHHLMGNIEMQKNSPDWNKALQYYDRALQEQSLLLKTSASDYVPMTENTAFSKMYFQNNMYDLLVHQTISGLMSNWNWRKNEKVQFQMIDLYDSLIGSYGKDGLNLPAAALLSHEAKILFLSEDEVMDKLQLSQKDCEKSFRDLIELYEKETSAAMADALADVHLKLAESLCRQDKLKEAMETLRSAWKKYAKTALAEDIQKKINWIESPALSLDIPFIYPSIEEEITVNYKNITGIRLETYQLDLSPASAELNGNSSTESLCHKYGKKTDTQLYKLPATTDYRPHVEKLTYTLPEAGIYIIKATPAGKQGKADYRLIYVSPLQFIAIPLQNGKTEITVIDGKTGNPVPEAEVIQYRHSRSGKGFISQEIWKTDTKGSIILNHPQRENLYINARTPGKDFMGISPIYSGNRSHQTLEKSWTPLTTLFSDRSIYRPGQIVHISGIQYEQLGDSLRTADHQSLKVELLDANRKRLTTETAITDYFGVFAVDFTLPQQVMPGYFTIRTPQRSINIRVEHYKRPTFDVTFAPVKQTYTFGDSLQLSGTAETFAGSPVRLAHGTYTLVRSEAWLWRRGRNETILDSGSFTTDASGKFSIRVMLKPPFNLNDPERIPYYKYTVRTSVTDRAGETRDARLSLPIGKYSFGLQIAGLKSKLAREEQQEIQFQALNLKQEPLKKEVTYKIFKCDNLHENSKPVYEGKAMTGQTFIPQGIYNLPNGKYKIQATACDGQQRTVSTTQEFILFSLSDKRPPIHTTQWFYQQGKDWETDDTLSLYIGSSEENIYLFMDVFTHEKRIRSERVMLNNEIQRFDFTYKEQYGNGITITFVFLRDGKLYSKTINLKKPEPQKQLTLKWETFRDQLTPGQEEVWRMRITDPSGQPANANLLAALYDASLDQLQPQQWWSHPSYNRWLPFVRIQCPDLNRQTNFYIQFPYLENRSGYRLLDNDIYSQVLSFRIWERPLYFQPMLRQTKQMYTVNSKSFSVNAVPEYEEAQDKTDAVFPLNDISESPTPSLRENFNETAFYYPMLRTDKNGEVTISFTLPDALTAWKFMGLAHTRDLCHGQLTSRVTASKPFMVQPNLPRFVRAGDAGTLAVSLINMSMKDIEGKIRLELADPVTNKTIYTQQQPFIAGEGETAQALFSYRLTDEYDILICRVVAEAGEFSDGEQHYLPVLSDKEWITETLPFQVDADGSTDLPLNTLFNRQSHTATGKRITLELTANPNWYVIQALPVAGNPSQDDAISWATSLYANALSLQLVSNNPEIQRTFTGWLAETGNTSIQQALWSKLETNTDLKNILLEESPWLIEAQSEKEQKQRVAMLFEKNGMTQRLSMAIRQLHKLQTTNGSWSWYPGMPGNRYTTTQIIELMARLKGMGIKLDASINNSYYRGLEYLKQQLKEEQNRNLPEVSGQALHYLYICALDKEAQEQADKSMNRHFIDRIINHGNEKSLSIHGKAMLATIMQSCGEPDRAATLLQSVKEYLVYNPELGYYFDTHKAEYSWNSYRIPTHVAAMEAIQRIHPDKQVLQGMQKWLLKQKQVQAWSTPLETADAIYAFLSNQENATDCSGKITVQIGRKQLETPGDALGYTRTSSIDPHHLPRTLHIEKKGKGIGWGAVYAQYFEKSDKLEASQNKDLSIRREYRINGHKADSKSVLHPGDRLTVRLLIQNSRDMDFVVIKDQRAACMEPVEQLSGFEWCDGLGAYRVNHDTSTEYFIDKLNKGKHILEYDVFITRTGCYQCGPASIQSVYAPEFISHTSGTKLKIE